MPTQSDTIVIGGGLSGLTAAVDLVHSGHRVTLLESRPKLGGRAYSYTDKTTGDVVDNGQHLLMGCFHSTRRFLRMIGADSGLRAQKNLEVTFHHPGKGFVKFRCPRLLSPFHLIVGLLRFRLLSFRDRLKLCRVVVEVFYPRVSVSKRDSMSVDDWLTACGQSEASKKYFWNVIATATLNEDPRIASASFFARVLRDGFLGKAQDSVLMIPNTGLSELYVEKAQQFIEGRGGVIRTNAHVEQLRVSENRISGVVLRNGEKLTARAIISAVPFLDLNLLATVELNMGAGYGENNDSRVSSIVSINLWLDRQVMDSEFISLLDSPIQWIFNKGRILNNGESQGSYLSCIVSGASEMVEMEKDELVRLALREVSRAYPGTKEARLLHSVVVKEKRATLSSAPEAHNLRLSSKTRFKNFFLAGDWTDTGLPQTIESAVVSGFSASELAKEYLAGNQEYSAEGGSLRQRRMRLRRRTHTRD